MSMRLTQGQKETLALLTAVFAVFSAAGVATLLPGSPTIPPTPDDDTTAPPPWSYTGYRAATSLPESPPPAGCGEITHFSNEAEIRAHIQYLASYNASTGYWGGGRMEGDGAFTTGAPTPGSPSASASGAAPEYSTTNNQVAGVDEADTTKTDGWFVYTVSGDSVVIVRAYPPERAEVVARIKADGWVSGLFVNGDRLAVIASPSYGYWGWGYGAVPEWDSFGGKTELLVFDISDRADPKLLTNVSVSGSYSSARMIGDYVYLITNFYAYEWEGDLILPYMAYEGTTLTLPPTAIGYSNGSLASGMFATVLGINITRASSPHYSAVMIPSYAQTYVSRGNIYLAASTYFESRDSSSWRQETHISKLVVYQGRVACGFEGSVPGTVLNQFSMDEYGGNLRVATTTFGDQPSVNNVFILDERLERAGAVEGLAPGETIRSVRFAAERGYIVTFRTIDPLFALDLSDPTAPAVLGFLKVPGFSQYLHPIDSTHLLGVGVETESADATRWSGIQGLKISLFDVTDPAAPREAAKYVFPTGSYSEAQYDHKAFLYIPSRSMLVIPVQTWEQSPTPGTFLYPGYSTVHQAAFVFKVNADTGFELIGSVTHEGAAPADASSSCYYWQPTDQIRRSLYIGENLYTVSQSAIKINRLSDLEAVGTVAIAQPEPVTEPCVYGPTAGGALD